jgi:hypothetical protein
MRSQPLKDEDQIALRQAVPNPTVSEETPCLGIQQASGLATVWQETFLREGSGLDGETNGNEGDFL